MNIQKMKATKDSEKYTTKADLKEAVNAILGGMEEMSKNFATKTDLNRVESLVKSIGNKVDELRVEVHYIKDEIKNIKADISVLPVH